MILNLHDVIRINISQRGRNLFAEKTAIYTRRNINRSENTFFISTPHPSFVKFDSVESCFDFFSLRCDFDVTFKEGNNDGSLL